MTNPFSSPPASIVQTGNQIITEEAPFGVTENMSEPVSFNDTSIGTENKIDPFSGGGANINPTPQPDKQRYIIIDMFWLLNPKFYLKQQPAQNEAHFVIISYNVSFGNLRLSYFNLTNNSIQNNIVYLENLKRTVSGTIYPATAFNVSSAIRISTTCLEQLFKQIPGANWQQERPVCTVEKNEEKIRFTVKDPKFGTYFYDFVTWQRDAFLHACNFTYTKGFEISAQMK